MALHLILTRALWNKGINHFYCTKAWEVESRGLGHAATDKARGSAQAPSASIGLGGQLK